MTKYYQKRQKAQNIKPNAPKSHLLAISHVLQIIQSIICPLVQDTLCGAAQTIEDIIPTLKRVQWGQITICAKNILVNEDTSGMFSILSLHHVL